MSSPETPTPLSPNSSTNPKSPRCPQCDHPIPSGAALGLCPTCLLSAGLPTQTGKLSDKSPLSPEDIAAEFPQLKILALLGRGGMGAVYQVRQCNLERIAALKILRPGLDTDPTFADRFHHEARALAQLNHPGIITLYETGRTPGGLYYILMEYVDGLTLRQLLDSARGPMPAREALEIVPQICDALQYAHNRGVIHRDIKPENILLDRQGRVKVADFGLARITTNTTAPETPGTQSGKIMGTPAYMAPEQTTTQGNPDHRADIYALGVVFYQMLTGELPQPGQPLTPPSQKVQIDVRLDEIVLRALAQNPIRRYEQASELKTQIELVTQTTLANPQRNSSTPPHKTSGPARLPRHPLIIPMTATFAATLVFLTMLVLANHWLPDRVASHFNGSGRADGWMRRDTFLLSFELIGLGVSFGIGALFFALRHLPNNCINLPNRAYWLAPERRDATMTLILCRGIWMVPCMLVFFTTLTLLTVLANRLSPPHLPSSWIGGLLTFDLLMIGAVLLMFVLPFIKKPSKDLPGSATMPHRPFPTHFALLLALAGLLLPLFTSLHLAKEKPTPTSPAPVSKLQPEIPAPTSPHPIPADTKHAPQEPPLATSATNAERDKILSTFVAVEEARWEAGLTDIYSIDEKKRTLYSFRRDAATSHEEKIKNQEFIIQIEKRYVDLVKARYASGISPYTETLQAQDSLLQAQQLLETLKDKKTSHSIISPPSATATPTEPNRLRFLMEAPPVTFDQVAKRVRATAAKHAPEATIEESENALQLSADSLRITLTRINQAPDSPNSLFQVTNNGSNFSFINTGFDPDAKEGVRAEATYPAEGKYSDVFFLDQMLRPIALLHLPFQNQTDRNGQPIRLIDIGTPFNGAMIESLQISLSPPDEEDRGKQRLIFNLSDRGQFLFQQLTGLAQDSRIAIVLDGRVLLAPTIKDQITTKTITLPVTLSEHEVLVLTNLLQPTRPSDKDTSLATEVTAIANASHQALIWLQLIDSGPDHYAQSWREASADFKIGITEADWVSTLKALRPSLGSVISRRLVSSQEANTLPGAPDGHYVLMRFATDFSQQKSLIETVTFVRESDDTWRSIGYYIH